MSCEEISQSQKPAFLSVGKVTPGKLIRSQGGESRLYQLHGAFPSIMRLRPQTRRLAEVSHPASCDVSGSGSLLWN